MQQSFDGAVLPHHPHGHQRHQTSVSYAMCLTWCASWSLFLHRYVFDGKPPQLKSGEVYKLNFVALSLWVTFMQLAKRTERREQAQAELTKAEEAGLHLLLWWIKWIYVENYVHIKVISYVISHSPGDAEEVEKYTRRLVKVTPQHNEDCKQLLTLMGIPFVSVRQRCFFCHLLSFMVDVMQAPCEAEAQCAALCKAGKVCICLVYID